jgi:hypothetical protein
VGFHPVQGEFLGLCPIKSVIAYLHSFGTSSLDLPPEWQLCDGSIIHGGVLDGEYTPDLNGEKYFLRG